MDAKIQNMIFDFLDEAQEMFGEKIDGWNLYGLEIKEKGPNLLYYPDEGNVTIALSNKVIDNDHLFIFQLSHEICHLLHPSQNFKTKETYLTTNFNEGLSTYFQIHIISKFYDNKVFIESLKDINSNYYEAYELVRELISYDADVIKKLRKMEPRIDLINETHFEELDLEIPKKLIAELIKPFKY